MAFASLPVGCNPRQEEDAQTTAATHPGESFLGCARTDTEQGAAAWGANERSDQQTAAPLAEKESGASEAAGEGFQVGEAVDGRPVGQVTD